MEDHGRIPVTKFKSESDNLASPSPAGESSLASSSNGQKTGDPTKLTAAQQTRIDYFLLHFIIGCLIAFVILNSGFFWDFVTCL